MGGIHNRGTDTGSDTLQAKGGRRFSYQGIMMHAI